MWFFYADDDKGGNDIWIQKWRKVMYTIWILMCCFFIEYIPLYYSSFVVCKYCTGILFVQSNFSLPPETWQLHGDAIWWPLCASLNVTVLNLLWVNLQRILFCSVSYIWTVCLPVPRCYMQVYLYLFFYLFIYFLFHGSQNGRKVVLFLARCVRFPKPFLQRKIWFLLSLKRITFFSYFWPPIECITSLVLLVLWLGVTMYLRWNWWRHLVKRIKIGKTCPFTHPLYLFASWIEEGRHGMPLSFAWWCLDSLFDVLPCWAPWFFVSGHKWLWRSLFVAVLLVRSLEFYIY